MIFLSLLLIIVAIALPSFKTQLSPLILTRITTIILIYSGALAFNALYIQSIGSGIGIYSGLFHITTISQQLDIFILTIGALILIPRPGLIEYIASAPAVSTNYEIKNNQPNKLNGSLYTEIVSGIGDKYSLIILFSTLGSTLLLSSSDLLSMYLSIELQSFGVYILATLFRDSRLATSAGLKYFLLGGFSSCLILLGSGLVYFYTGLTNLDSIYSIISISSNQSITQGLTLGIIIIMIGFLFKISAAPLHNWAPDVYDDSPTIVTIWLTIMPKIAILIFLLDLFIGGTMVASFNNTLPASNSSNVSSLALGGYDAIKNLLLLSSLFSLIVGTIVGLAQSRIKRLLAYSTISHIGFILLALAINSEQSIESFIFYIIQYSLTNLNTFLIILAFGYITFFNKFNSNKKSFRYGAYSDNKNIDNLDIRFITELKGQFMSNPLLSISLAICLFSMAGIPPLLGFFSKQMVLYSAIQSGYYFMSIVAILVSVISASYYLKIVRILFTQQTSSDHLNLTIPALSKSPKMDLVVPSPSPSPSKDEDEGREDNNIPFVNVHENYYISYYITNAHSFLISILTLVILFFILKPSLLLNSTQLLSLSLFYF
uniref:NADH dehydrogenase subunit 2 n=1 Tax=Phellinidium ferrugineofuscum TaxID=167367 RepID=UPI0023AB37C3|nr:NADH dehydrogenase subunit 2 [Phellinidium ferrugineofuscum]WCF76818.1 NADH dehydrogenase subunit 2 [Phellinidium ferrugineofuscum]